MTNGHDQSLKTSDDLDKKKQIVQIKYHFRKIMDALGLDLTDDNFSETPQRVAEMYVKEIFSGLDPENKPNLTSFDNDAGYDGMLIQKNITLYSYCAHHFVPIIGKAHVAYYPSDNFIGLSKINRLVNYIARKPQTQEKLTVEIGELMKESLKTDDIAVLIEADHLCVASRGIKDTNSTTETSYYRGKFREQQYRNEFLKSLP